MTRARSRVRGLQDIMSRESHKSQNRLVMINELAQIQREKERITQERQNWQNKIDFIDARLAQIETKEAQFHQLLVDEDKARDDQAVRQQSRRKAPGDHTTAPEDSVAKVTIRY